jgi:hypothetical protein
MRGMDDGLDGFGKLLQLSAEDMGHGVRLSSGPYSVVSEMVL